MCRILCCCGRSDIKPFNSLHPSDDRKLNRRGINKTNKTKIPLAFLLSSLGEIPQTKPREMNKIDDYFRRHDITFLTPDKNNHIPLINIRCFYTLLKLIEIMTLGLTKYNIYS